MAGYKHLNGIDRYYYTYSYFYFYGYYGKVKAVCDAHEQVPA